MKKRILSILLTLCIMICLVPTGVFAEGEAYNCKHVNFDQSTGGCKVSGCKGQAMGGIFMEASFGSGTNYYYTVAEFMAAANKSFGAAYRYCDIKFYLGTAETLTLDVVNIPVRSLFVANGNTVGGVVLCNGQDVTITGGRFDKVTVKSGCKLTVTGGSIGLLTAESGSTVDLRDSADIDKLDVKNGSNVTINTVKEVKDAKSIEAALKNNTVSTVKLTENITMDSTLAIERAVKLDLNGYVLKNESNTAVSSLGSGNLTIVDSNSNARHKFTFGSNGLWVLDEQNGIMTVKGGIIIGFCNDYDSGGGITVSGGKVVMNAGNIFGCKSNYGGGVYVESDGTFTMTGGSIFGCTAANGSALYLSDGTMSAGGGTVDGAVLLDGDSTIIGGGSTFSGLIINNNTQARFSGAHSSLGIVGEKPMGVNGHNYCTVTFDSEDGTMENTTRYFLRGKNISGEIKPEPRTGYTFGGWNKADGTAWDYAKDTVTEGITLYAKWIPLTYTVTFDSTGGSEVITKNMDVTYGEQLGDMPVPIRTGYFFCGWYDALVGGKCYGNSDGKGTSQYDKTENCTLYAQWKINQYKITVKPENGEADIVIKQDFGTAVTAPTLTRKGYVFDGWDIIFPTTMPAENITIKALWKDVEKPTGKIEIGENSWKSFLNNITFGLFFKDTQTVTVIATDNSGETVKIEYLLSNKELTLAELENKTFTAYNGQFNINPDNEYIIYVKLTDKAGNTDYICSDGIVLDETKPVIVGIDEGTTYCESQTVTINEKYIDIDSVKVNGTKVTLDKNNRFVLEPKNGKQQIVVTDKAGNQAIMTVTVNDGHTLLADDDDCTTPVYCKFCNAEVVAAKSHNFTGNWLNDETDHWHICQNENCTVTDTKIAHSVDDDGNCLTAVVCECGYVITAAKPAHTFGEWVSNGDGTHTRKCTVSGCTDGIETENCSGGKATCKDKAECNLCGTAYGKTDPNNHADIKHIDAKAATKEAGGNVGYWHCEDCDKYYSDAAATKEISKADTVTERLKEETKSPKTSDSNEFALWIALLFISGGAVIGVTVISKKKKRSVRQ